MNEIVQAMVTRRSCRQYWDRPVPEELLDQVLLAGTYAANGRGRQAGRIVVLTKKEDITALEKLNVQALGNPEAQPFYGAPVVLVVLADKSVHTAVEDGSLVTCSWLPTLWVWEPAGFIAPGRNLKARRAKRSWLSGASPGITSAWATAFWATPPQRPRPLPPASRERALSTR